MPVRGIDVIEGIPVYLKGNVMYAFRHEAAAGQPEVGRWAVQPRADRGGVVSICGRFGKPL